MNTLHELTQQSFKAFDDVLYKVFSHYFGTTDMEEIKRLIPLHNVELQRTIGEMGKQRLSIDGRVVGTIEEGWVEESGMDVISNRITWKVTFKPNTI